MRSFSLRYFSIICCRWDVYWCTYIPYKLFFPEKFRAMLLQRWLLVHLVDCFLCGKRIIVHASPNSPLIHRKLFVRIIQKVLVRYGVIAWFKILKEIRYFWKPFGMNSKLLPKSIINWSKFWVGGEASNCPSSSNPWTTVFFWCL